MNLSDDLQYSSLFIGEIEKEITQLSPHVETVCLLSKLKSSKYIEMELKMDELDLTASESKATY